jgi:hypothetical protein
LLRLPLPPCTLLPLALLQLSVLVLPVRLVLVLELVKRVNVPVQLELLKKNVELLYSAVPPLVPLTYFQ